jgi:hypothetical protein
MFKHKIFVDDVIYYILASLPNKTFPTSAINIAFYELKKKYPECFENLIFHTSCQPYSERISNMVVRAYIAELFECGNTFSDKKKESFKKHIYNRFTPFQLEKINDMINTIKTEKLL